ncbi:MAG TPA: mandelate racemase/muconate lactonizing enzyme family protein [Trebonia sp.]|jgi:L-alanine-DL-glutamate epimerase-like enolase superfamily enzyme|nr:mandelate racemase/muconate lactonizing enzyme family protein [Trebonia sp.]
MRVDGIEAIPLAYTEPNDNGSTRHLLLTRVTTDTGHVGWGEAVTMWPEATRSTAALVEGLAPLVIGREPSGHEAIWTALQEHTWWYGNGGIAAFAIAALDIALWDLAGQEADRNIIDLLGGPVHTGLPVVISCHAIDSDLQRMTETMASWVRDQQAQGIKIGFGKRGEANLGADRDRDLRFIQLLRAALPDRARIMIDIGASIHWDVDTAVTRALDWQPYDIAWIEEPLGADNPVGYRKLKQATTIPVAYGEREWTPRGVQRIAETGTVDIVGVDPGRVEGLTGFRRANDAVLAAGAQINAHAWSSAIVTAASLAVSLAAPNCRQIEIKPLRNPMQHELATHPIHPRNGQLAPLSGPGLGITIDPAAVERHRMH